MAKKQENIINKYIKKHNSLKNYEEKAKKIKQELAEIQEEILNQYEKPPKVDGYRLNFSTRRVWGGWAPDIIKKEDELKHLKSQAKRVGNVEYSVIRYITLKKKDEITDQLQNKKTKN